MEIRRLDRERFVEAYGLIGQALLPWAALNAPFEGAWCVVRAGTTSVEHAHHEYEIFVGVSGRAELCAGDERTEFTVGDIVHFRPGVPHYLVNTGEEDFEYYSIWWDAEMSERFMARHRGSADE